ncbi:MAG TPA: calcium-binding protein, partial [Burkholderiales bacterium]
MATINGTEGNDQLSGGADPDTINGFGGSDFLAGNDGADSIVGGAGNDTIFGDSGNDWLEGSAGNDTMSGGSGQDSYAFHESGATNADLVTNFDSNWDKIQLDAAGFSAIGASGRFASGDVRFFAGAGATGGHDADDRIIYNTSTGQLFYDADGSGAGTAQLIATFQGAPTITAADLNVFGTATPPPPPPPPPSGSTINGTDGNDSLLGTSGNDTINGFGGNDTIDGAAGADSMVGGDGDDVYFVDNAGDLVVEAQNAGIDEVRSTLPSYTLPAWVNNLLLPNGTALNGFGNDIENLIQGNDSSNRLEGGAGNDTIFGFNDLHTSLYPGNDTVIVGECNDSLVTLYGSDSLDGG